MVGPGRFELPTSCTPCKRATRLRYGPNKEESDTKPDHTPRSKRFFGVPGIPGFKTPPKMGIFPEMC